MLVIFILQIDIISKITHSFKMHFSIIHFQNYTLTFFYFFIWKLIYTYLYIYIFLFFSFFYLCFSSLKTWSTSPLLFAIFSKKFSIYGKVSYFRYGWQRKITSTVCSIYIGAKTRSPSLPPVKKFKSKTLETKLDPNNFQLNFISTNQSFPHFSSI